MPDPADLPSDKRPVPDRATDYRALLKKYMGFIVDRESTDFITEWPHEEKFFSVDEWAILLALSAEIRGED